MKYCVSSRQEKEYLEKADEIMVEYRDRDIIYDLIENYPEKTIILQTPREGVDYKEIEGWVGKANLICCLENIYDMDMCKNIGAKYYYAYPANTFFELQGLAAAGVCYAYLGMPIFFDIAAAAKIGVPLRAVPNIAYEKYIPRENGICGQWIRPEDIELYEPYVEAIEFHTAHLSQERALFRIYAEKGHWPGEMKDIITNFDIEGCLNRVVYDEIGKIRLSCKQKCQAGHPCTLCERSVRFGEIVQRYTDLKKQSEEN